MTKASDNTQQQYYIAEQIAAVRALHHNVLSRAHGAFSISELLAAQANNVLAAHGSENPAVVFHLACWCPGLVSKPASEIFSHPLTIDEAKLSMAREYGYENWSQVEGVVDVTFESAVDALMHGELEVLQGMIKADPALATQTSAYGHRATLLHYLGANGVETQRQVAPYNAGALCELLISSGADVNASANIYGGSTALQLVESSAHPHAAGVVEAVAAVLRGHGAEG